ncbi:glycosyltransferase family 2 protein [Marinobacter lacisalsi]|uniref:Glycosyltransferase family 2 protein n=1 Tax=Marinobacter lacisalsi TaxID=475979 RepID=A0ABV8QMZ1_9GAMM
MPHNPELSIIVPACNEGDNLADTVSSLLENTRGIHFELIVVDDGSDDGSADRLKQHPDPRLRILSGPRQGPARARNRGAEMANGRLLLFMDAHCYAPQGWLQPLLDALDDHPGTGVVGPAISNTQNLRMCGYGGTWRDARLDMIWLPHADQVREVPFQPAGCQLVRREAFTDAGGYDGRMSRWGSEDVEFCIRVWRAGWHIRVQPASTVAHYFRQKPPYQIDHYRIIYNRVRMVLMHFEGRRLARILRHQFGSAQVEHALAEQFLDPTTQADRTAYQQRFPRSTDWFCDYLGLLPE